mgnify:CR=1 FL=1
MHFLHYSLHVFTTSNPLSKYKFNNNVQMEGEDRTAIRPFVSYIIIWITHQNECIIRSERSFVNRETHAKLTDYALNLISTF